MRESTYLWVKVYNKSNIIKSPSSKPLRTYKFKNLPPLGTCAHKQMERECACMCLCVCVCVFGKKSKRGRERRQHNTPRNSANLSTSIYICCRWSRQNEYSDTWANRCQCNATVKLHTMDSGVRNIWNTWRDRDLLTTLGDTYYIRSTLHTTYLLTHTIIRKRVVV